MEDTRITIGKRVIPLNIIRSARAKHVSLRISAAKDSVVMTLPMRATRETAMKFLEGKQDWVLSNVESYKRVTIAAGIKIPVLGREYTIRRREGRGVTKLDNENEELLVYCQPEFTARRVKEFLKKILQKKCEKRSLVLAEKLGKKVKHVTISKARSHWGSCNGRGGLSFNWLLVFAPPEILEYIIAHEVGHLKHMDHSHRFWGAVQDICSHMEGSREWLRDHGHLLHRYE